MELIAADLALGYNPWTFCMQRADFKIVMGPHRLIYKMLGNQILPRVTRSAHVRLEFLPHALALGGTVENTILLGTASCWWEKP